jgi:hypothetical protein
MLNWYCLKGIISLKFKLKENNKMHTFISPLSDNEHGWISAVNFCAALSNVKCAKTSTI